MERDVAFNLLVNIRDEHQAARFAVTETGHAFQVSAEWVRAGLDAGVTSGKLARCARNLEATYVIRLFSEFEGILLSYWQGGLGRRTRPKVHVLIERIADIRKCDSTTRADAHEVQEYRNDIIHEQLRDARLTLQQCQNQLDVFLSWLPPRW